MQYKYNDDEKRPYVINLKFSNNRLLCETDNHRNTMIVQTTYGNEISNKLKDICKYLSDANFNFDNKAKYSTIKKGINVFFASYPDQVKCNGININGEASTYTAFCYTVEKDVCTIYAPVVNKTYICKCDIPLVITIKIQEEFTKRFFKLYPSGFYSINFSDCRTENYSDGMLSYVLGDDRIQIPITRKMIAARTVYIKTPIKPQIIKSNEGVRINVEGS